MIRKQNQYILAYVVWSVVAMGGFFLVVTGMAEASLTPADFPAVAGAPRELTAFGAMVVVFLAGAAVLRGLQKLSWMRAGRTAGLSREGGLFPTPHLTGTVDGRAVRAHTITRRERTTTAKDNSTKKSYTVVEAELDDPVDEGVVITREGEQGLIGGLLGGDEPATGRDRIEVVDDSEALPVDDHLSGRTQDALLEPAYFDTLSVGDAPAWLTNERGPIENTFLGAIGSGTLAQQRSGDVHDDPAWVTLEAKGTTLDPDELARQVDAAVSVAESYERVEAEPHRA